MIVVSPEVSALPTSSVVQAVAPDVGRTEGDVAERSSEVIVLGERSTSAPLASPAAKGGVPAEASPSTTGSNIAVVCVMCTADLAIFSFCGGHRIL